MKKLDNLLTKQKNLLLRLQHIHKFHNGTDNLQYAFLCGKLSNYVREIRPYLLGYKIYIVIIKNDQKFKFKNFQKFRATKE